MLSTFYFCDCLTVATIFFANVPIYGCVSKKYINGMALYYALNHAKVAGWRRASVSRTNRAFFKGFYYKYMASKKGSGHFF